VLPFELDDVEKQQPRLLAARKLVASNGVRVIRSEGATADVEVAGTDVQHFVAFAPYGIAVRARGSVATRDSGGHASMSWQRA
jgi:hypothetical protein